MVLYPQLLLRQQEYFMLQSEEHFWVPTTYMPDILLDAGSFGFSKGTFPFYDGLTDNEKNQFNVVSIRPFFLNVSSSHHPV